MTRFSKYLLLVQLFCLLIAGVHAAPPIHVYLTWTGDTSTSMTVNFQTRSRSATEVYFDTRSRDGKPERYRQRASGSAHRMENHPDGRYIHWVELKGLKAGETYYFIAGDEKSGFSPERKFRTIPSGSKPLRFVTGGDMGTGPLLAPLLRQAARQDPAFGLVGGDIAYANGELRNYSRWDIWLETWGREMITPTGYTIPMVLGIGNHEVIGGLEIVGGRAPFYFGYFAQAGSSYFTKTFGGQVVIYCLDSGHLAAHAGNQTTWLEEEMKNHQHIRHQFAVYHAPLYPSHRRFLDVWPASGRAYWLPLFDKYGLTAAFENHDHVFKRTYLLKGNQIDPEGTLYLGDGCWGREPRTVDAVRRWYERKAAPIAHFWRVDVNGKSVVYQAINAEGKIFDVFPEDHWLSEKARENYLLLTLPVELPPK